jgi:hypothetical protein
MTTAFCGAAFSSLNALTPPAQAPVFWLLKGASLQKLAPRTAQLQARKF